MEKSWLHFLSPFLFKISLVLSYSLMVLLLIHLVRKLKLYLPFLPNRNNTATTSDSNDRRTPSFLGPQLLCSKFLSSGVLGDISLHSTHGHCLTSSFHSSERTRGPDLNIPLSTVASASRFQAPLRPVWKISEGMI